MDAEYWHGKALELSVKFLPGDCPLVKHIHSSYKNKYCPWEESIPEDAEVASDIIMIKPLNGVEVQQVSPIIKKILDPAVKLSPIDLEPNDYLTEFKIKSSTIDNTNEENKESLESKTCISGKEENSKEEQELLKSVRFIIINNRVQRG